MKRTNGDYEMPTVANITTATTIKTSAGKVKSISIVVAGSTIGTINACAATGDAAAANAYIGLPNTVGFGSFGPAGWLFPTGITVVPGTSQVIAVEYE